MVKRLEQAGELSKETVFIDGTICLAIIIPALKTGCMPVIVPLAFKKPAEHFQIPLVLVLPFASPEDNGRKAGITVPKCNSGFRLRK